MGVNMDKNYYEHDDMSMERPKEHYYINPFIQQLVNDLKKFSAELLAPGLGGTQQIAGSVTTVANTSALLSAIEVLTGLLPHLIAELQCTDSTRKIMLHYTASPKRAGFSQRASDYQQDLSNGRLLPKHWLRVEPLPELDIRPLRWLLHLLELQEAALREIQKRTTKYIDDSLRIQQGYSSYAQNDRATLFNMRLRLYEAQAKLDHARIALLKSVQYRFMSSPTLPHPFPRSHTWIKLRLYAQQLISPKDYLPGFLHNLLYGTVEIADTPYLYQRWCGIKLLQTFERLEWECQDDPIGALFLGGQITLRKHKTDINIWVEPRFVRGRAHPSGFACQVNGETNPDYLIVTPGASGGVDGFILDPTTTAAADIRQSKGRYLDTLETVGMATVAGIPVVRTPLRAWSAAPLHTPHCELGDVEGRTGTIPMHPLDWLPDPLLEWVKDIDKYALAWSQQRIH